jgi:hypothetical protein
MKISQLTLQIFLIQLGLEQDSFILFLIFILEKLCLKGKKERKFVRDEVHT